MQRSETPMWSRIAHLPEVCSPPAELHAVLQAQQQAQAEGEWVVETVALSARQLVVGPRGVPRP